MLLHYDSRRMGKKSTDNSTDSRASGTKSQSDETLQPVSGVLPSPGPAPPSILDRPLQPRQSAKRAETVSSSLLSFLFAEIVKYSLNQVNQADQLEARLHELGLRVGYRVLELCYYRDKPSRRDTRLLQILTFLSQTCWRFLFGHQSELLKGQDQENEYMINDKQLILTKFISVPKDIGHISCAAYAAGIVEGALCSAEFPAEVTAHTVDESPTVTSTTILIRFLPEDSQAGTALVTIITKELAQLLNSIA